MCQQILILQINDRPLYVTEIHYHFIKIKILLTACIIKDDSWQQNIEMIVSVLLSAFVNENTM